MKFDPIKKVGRANNVQGSLLCTGCMGTGEYPYKNHRGQTVLMKCPLCKGDGKPTFKGKRFLIP